MMRCPGGGSQRDRRAIRIRELSRSPRPSPARAEGAAWPGGRWRRGGRGGGGESGRGEEWRRSGAKVVVARFQGRNGHPVLFDKSCVAEILELRAPATLKDVVARHARAVEVDDPGVVIDLDTQEDYQAEVRRLA